MGQGILLDQAVGRRPSEHYSAHFPGSSAALSRLTRGLIDGDVVTLSGPLTIVPHKVSPDSAQFAVVDESDGANGVRAFVVALTARTIRDRGTPWDPRGTPLLLSNLHNGRRWDVYNCRITDFQVYPRERLDRGKWPRLPVRTP